MAGVILSTRDARRVQAAIRFHERNRNPRNRYRRRNKRGGGISTTADQYGKIIEVPTPADYTQPEGSELYNGRAWYTVRPVGSTFTVWATGVDVTTDQVVVYPDADGPSYRCRIPHRTDTDKKPGDVTNAWWEKLEEIRIEYSLGHEEPARDLRDCVPGFIIGEILPYISRGSGSTLRYYFDQTIFWTGDPPDSSIRYNTTEFRTMAVFK